MFNAYYFNNGFVEFKISTGGGLDSNGLPIEVSESWGEKVKCHIVINSKNNKGVAKDGKFSIVTYTVFMDLRDFETDTIRLSDRDNKVLGEFKVQNVEKLTLVNRLKIEV